MESTIRPLLSSLVASLLIGSLFASNATAMQVRRAPTPKPAPMLPVLTPEQLEILEHMSIVYLDDGTGNLVNKTIRISGVNVQIVNGSGTTTGLVDGMGNLIVGYNELRGGGDDRTGSHNLIVGKAHNYNSYGPGGRALERDFRPSCFSQRRV